MTHIMFNFEVEWLKSDSSISLLDRLNIIVDGPGLKLDGPISELVVKFEIGLSDFETGR